jgi:predicted nucleic acid-binding protein
VGILHNRALFLKLWHSLFSIDTVTHSEALYFIEVQQLMGKGIGYIDVQLIASVSLQSDTQFWTRDKRLVTVVNQLGLHFPED